MEYLQAFLDLLSFGINTSALADFFLRAGVGVPFMVSGLNKMFCPFCRDGLYANLRRSGIPNVDFCGPWVAFWEAFAGFMLVIGLFTGAAAFILFVVCIVAFMVSWWRKLEKKNPRHIPEAITEVGFQFDLLLIWMLLAIMMIGPGVISMDHILFGG